MKLRSFTNQSRWQHRQYHQPSTMASKTLAKVFEAARPQRSCDPSTFFRSCRLQPMRPISAPRYKGSDRSQLCTTSLRPFSSTAAPRATIVKQNPRQDDEGNEMQIVISERAAKRLKKITSASQKKNTLSSAPATPPDAHLRVSVTAGGCHGFQYLMSLEPANKIDLEEDTIFEFKDSGEAGDTKAEVVLDLPSLELLKGSTIDFTTELIGSQFKIVGNPRATSSCGCGTSFDIDV